MYLIGLTGGISCGKSTISKIFQNDYKIPVIDADLISHQIVEPKRKGWYRIKKVFGDEVFNSDETLNRDKMGNIIFKDVNKRKQLNKCLHDLILIEIIKQIFLYLIKGYNYIIIDVPLLFEFKLALKLISYKLVVYCNEEEQLKRLLERNKQLNENDAKLRIKSQMNNNERIKLADFIIDNSFDLDKTKQQVYNLNQIFKNSKKHIPIRLAFIILFASISTGFMYFLTKLLRFY